MGFAFVLRIRVTGLFGTGAVVPTVLRKIESSYLDLCGLPNLCNLTAASCVSKLTFEPVSSKKRKGVLLSNVHALTVGRN